MGERHHPVQGLRLIQPAKHHAYDAQRTDVGSGFYVGCGTDHQTTHQTAQTMNIFPEQPKVSRDDTLRIFGHIKNRNVLRQWIKTDPTTDDLKRAVMIEVYRAMNSTRSPLTAISRGVCYDLIVAIQKRERSAIDDAIMGLLAPQKEPITDEEYP
jgi:hypothetical protein